MDAVHPVEVTAHRDAEAPVAGPVGQTAPPPAGQVPLLGLAVEGAALLVEAGALPGVVEPVPLIVVKGVMTLAAEVPVVHLVGALIVLLLVVKLAHELAEQVALVAQLPMINAREHVLVSAPEDVSGHALVAVSVAALVGAGPAVLVHVVVDANRIVMGIATWGVMVVAFQDVAVVVLVNVQLLVADALGVPVAAVDVAADVIAAAPLGVKDPVPAAAKDALENALPAVADALGALDVLETVLGNAPADATPTAPAAQETVKGTAPSRALTLAPPLVMGLARLA